MLMPVFPSRLWVWHQCASFMGGSVSQFGLHDTDGQTKRISGLGVSRRAPILTQFRGSVRLVSHNDVD